MTPTPEELRAQAEAVFCAQHPYERGARGASPTHIGERLLDSMPMARGRVLTVSIIDKPRFDRQPLYAFRYWNVNPLGTFAATPYSLTVKAEQLPYFAAAVAKAMEHELARLPGWMSGDGTRPPAVSAGAPPSTPPAPDTRED